MLVLSRKDGESIEIPELGIVIQVTSIKKSRVTLGIKAPKELAILRGEMAEQAAAVTTKIASESKPQCFAVPSTASIAVKELSIDYAPSGTDPNPTSLFQVA